MLIYCRKCNGRMVKFDDSPKSVSYACTDCWIEAVHIQESFNDRVEWSRILDDASRYRALRKKEWLKDHSEYV